MKKILFTIVVAICLVSCGDYYYEESRAERAYYATDSTACVVEGVWETVQHPYQSFSHAYGPVSVRAIVTKNVTYYYQWQSADGPRPIDARWDSIANTAVKIGDRIRAYGMVRTITDKKSFSFQDIIIDSVEICTPLYRYTDTIEHAVIQGEYRPMILWLSDSVSYTNPCLYLPSPTADYPYHPEEKYYINPDINFQTVSKEYLTVYLCDKYVQQGQWVEIYGDLIIGIDTKDEPYWWVNMDSVKNISIPDKYKR